MTIQESIQIVAIFTNFILSIVIIIIQVNIKKRMDEQHSQYDTFQKNKVEVLIDLYDKLIDCDLTMNRYFSGYSQVYGEEETKIMHKNFINNNYKLQSSIKKAELFLDNKLIDKIAKYEVNVQTIWNDNFWGFYKYHSKGNDESIDWDKFRKQDLKKISDNSSKLQNDLKKLFVKEIKPKD